MKNHLALIKAHMQLFAIDNMTFKESKSYYVMEKEINELNLLCCKFVETSKQNDMLQIDINRIVSELILDWKIYGNTADITFKSAENSIFINGNAENIKEMISNLIKNSIEAFTGTGKIDILTEKSNGDVILTLADNGNGMPPEVLKNINNDFFTTKKEGSGIGLAVCNKIVMDHHGTMSISSIEGEGTKVIVRLKEFL